MIELTTAHAELLVVARVVYPTHSKGCDRVDNRTSGCDRVDNRTSTKNRFDQPEPAWDSNTVGKDAVREVVSADGGGLYFWWESADHFPKWRHLLTPFQLINPKPFAAVPVPSLPSPSPAPQFVVSRDKNSN